MTDPGLDSPTGWARLPRWQHVALIVLCSVGLVAALLNTAVAPGGDRLLHFLFGVLDGAVLVTLVRSYGRRLPQNHAGSSGVPGSCHLSVPGR